VVYDQPGDTLPMPRIVSHAFVAPVACAACTMTRPTAICSTWRTAIAGRPRRVPGARHRVRAVLPLGWPGQVRQRLLSDPGLAGVAARLGATPVQVALAWLLDLAPKILPIPGTRTRAHLAENLGAADVRLDDAARGELTAAFPPSW
jgi:hypothetical protein